MMNLAGIDYSLRGPAICIFAGDYNKTFSFQQCMFYFLTNTKKHARMYRANIVGDSFDIFMDDSERYDSISDWAMEKILPVDHVCLEGYAYSSNSNRLFQIAENTGVLKFKIWQKRLPLSITPPSQIKKFATGKGNANKNDMYEAFIKETDVDLMSLMTPSSKSVSNPISDIVDSYYICKYLYTTLSHANAPDAPDT